MDSYNNLVFLGTSHIARQSMEEVKRLIENENPDLIALELDSKRVIGLMSKNRQKMKLADIRKIGLKGYFFSILGSWAERKLGKLVGVAPGSEMKQAIILAKKKNLQISLIDQDIEITLKRLSAAITWKEKLHFIGEVLKALFVKKPEIDFDLRTVPDKKIIKKLTDKLKKEYPNVHKVLIDERNEVIASNLKQLMNSHKDKKILVIVGAGHVDDLIKLLKHGNESINYSFTVG